VSLISFQPIEVEHHDTESGFRANGVATPGFDLAIQRPTIGQAGQRDPYAIVLRLFEARRVVDHSGRLIAHAARGHGGARR
jgi:hypothetical protein